MASEERSSKELSNNTNGRREYDNPSVFCSPLKGELSMICARNVRSSAEARYNEAEQEVTEGAVQGFSHTTTLPSAFGCHLPLHREGKINCT